MGPIQTLIGKALAVTGGAIAFGKKENENEEQVKQEAEQEKASSAMAAKAVKTAQDKKVAKPKLLYFDEKGTEPLATSGEMASVLSHVSLSSAISSKTRGRKKYEARLAYIKKRTLKREGSK